MLDIVVDLGEENDLGQELFMMIGIAPKVRCAEAILSQLNKCYKQKAIRLPKTWCERVSLECIKSSMRLQWPVPARMDWRRGLQIAHIALNADQPKTKTSARDGRPTLQEERETPACLESGQ